MTSVQPRFSILYADPPWAYQSWSRPASRVTRATQRPPRVKPLPYPTMPTPEICKLAVQPLCAEDCILFLWATYPMLPEAFKVIAAWGFTFKTVGFTWVKQSPSGNGFTFGLGYWTRANPEICLIATKGSPKRKRYDIPNLLLSPRREHSRKPDEARERIVALCGDLPRLELFARERPDGWRVWGNEVESDVEIAIKGRETADDPANQKMFARRNLKRT